LGSVDKPENLAVIVVPRSTGKVFNPTPRECVPPVQSTDRSAYDGRNRVVVAGVVNSPDDRFLRVVTIAPSKSVLQRKQRRNGATAENKSNRLTTSTVCFLGSVALTK
jgi:hypothetical protein